MDKIKSVQTRDDVIHLLSAALHHEWAVSFEYVIHAYSLPKGKFLYEDPVLKQTVDARGQTIQIGIDEMYHALQLGITLARLGVDPGFGTDEVVRYPLALDNFKRDKMTEEAVTHLYQSAEIAPAACFAPHPGREGREDLRLLHEICRLENEAMHRDLRYVILFNEHQDLSQRLFKNSVNHMRHWDKLSGVLVKLGDVVAIENATTDAAGVERSRRPMPETYPGTDRLSALETLPGLERGLAAKYEAALALDFPMEIEAQLKLHLALTREHVYTQDKLLANARRIQGLA